MEEQRSAGCREPNPRPHAQQQRWMLALFVQQVLLPAKGACSAGVSFWPNGQTKSDGNLSEAVIGRRLMDAVVRCLSEGAFKERQRKMNGSGVAVFDFDARETVALWMIVQPPGDGGG